MIGFLIGYCIACWIGAAVMLAKDPIDDPAGQAVVFWAMPVFMPIIACIALIAGIPTGIIWMMRKLLGEK